MNHNAKFLISTMILGALLTAGAAFAAPDNEDNNDSDVVLFKIHNIIPEKNEDGKVLHCNINATFFNRTQSDIANTSLTLVWEDQVISDEIDQEERAEKQLRRTKPKASVSRYPTSALTDRVVKTSLKLPPVKVNQQVSLKTKVDTDRCFLLLNDVDVVVNNCGTAGLTGKTAKDCTNMFRYISPKMPEYYQEFKEITLDQQEALEDTEMAESLQKVDELYQQTLDSIKQITAEAAENASEE